MKSITELGNIAAMVSDAIISVECVFHSGGKSYTYKAAKAEGYKVDDYVVVGSNAGEMKVLKVVAVHNECLLENIDAGVKYQWVISKVSLTRHAELLEWEEAAANQLYTAQRRQTQAAVLESLGVAGLVQDGGLSLAPPVAGDSGSDVIETMEPDDTVGHSSSKS